MPVPLVRPAPKLAPNAWGSRLNRMTRFSRHIASAEGDLLSWFRPENAVLTSQLRDREVTPCGKEKGRNLETNPIELTCFFVNNNTAHMGETNPRMLCLTVSVI